MSTAAKNALRHEFLDPVVVVRFQHRAEFKALQETYRDHFRPITPQESRLVHDMAVATWRIRRCWAAETSILDNTGAHPPVDRLRAGLALIRRYEERLQSNFDRALHSLKFPNEP